MLQVGVTGGIGSGKSLVCRIFQSMGVPIYEADARARELTNCDPEIRRNITEVFGVHSYTQDGLNRQLMAQEVFNNQEKLDRLNGIIHPVVGKDYKDWCHLHATNKVVIKEAAILFESGSYKSCDKVILVNAPESIRLSRVVERDGVSEEEVKQRMANQWSSEKKMELADFLIMNDGSQALIPQVIKVYKTLLEL
ncbi:MAG: dephospho-CoA kinase [Crocinitomicaceae bacterium]|nr:dephospho-CoA kinase [Crocinitomicaceae bacterium]|tara:strand:+ start:12314 stop:12898 length:585 start_codon:yes stop_codon:yes gene_type:complete